MLTRPTLLLFLTILISTVAALSPAYADDADIAPDWTLTTAEGDPLRLDEAVGERATVLFFWATWCPYCKTLMPHLQSIRHEMGDQVQILAIHIRDENDPVAFVRKAAYDFTVLMDGDEVAELNGIWGTPGILILDSERRVRFDLRKLPRPPLPDEDAKHGRKAAFLAPYWAAAIRRALDDVVKEYR